MRRGPIGMIWSFIGFIILAGLFIAFARAMNWDPFGAVDWVWTRLIEPVANYFSNSPWFQDATRRP